jgi:hypothetical protein
MGARAYYLPRYAHHRAVDCRQPGLSRDRRKLHQPRFLASFIPLLNHPVFALPVQSILTIALVFHWQYLDRIASPVLFPSAATLLKIVVYMALAYYVTREASIPLSRWVDRKLVVSGSIRRVSDALYITLQIPVMLIYCSFLESQLP